MTLDGRLLELLGDLPGITDRYPSGARLVPYQTLERYGNAISLLVEFHGLSECQRGHGDCKYALADKDDWCRVCHAREGFRELEAGP